MINKQEIILILKQEEKFIKKKSDRLKDSEFKNAPSHQVLIMQRSAEMRVLRKMMRKINNL